MTTPTKFKFDPVDPVDPDKQLADILAFTRDWKESQLTTEYDDLCERVFNARADFYHKNRAWPTHVFLGQREYGALRMKPLYTRKPEATIYQPETFFDSEVVIVLKDEFLKVA